MDARKDVYNHHLDSSNSTLPSMEASLRSEIIADVGPFNFGLADDSWLHKEYSEHTSGRSDVFVSCFVPKEEAEECFSLQNLGLQDMPEIDAKNGFALHSDLEYKDDTLVNPADSNLLLTNEDGSTNSAQVEEEAAKELNNSLGGLLFTDRPFQCEECIMTFHSRNDLMSHVRFHESGNPLQCHKCDQTFPGPAALKEHYLTHFVCGLCGKSFKQEYDLMNHFERHESGLVCYYCGKIFRRKAPFKRHLNAHKQTQECFECSECCQQFLSKTDLKKHIMTSHGTVEYHQCPLCEQRFLYHCLYKKHMEGHTTGPERYTCTECQVSFTRILALKNHSNAYHSNIKNYRCVVCSTNFTTKKMLYIHMTVHSKEETYRCVLCGQGFSRKTDLTRHTLEHGGLPRFRHTEVQCSEVPCTNFAQTSYITASTHRPLIQYNKDQIPEHNCSHCEESFYSNNDLSNHLETHRRFNRKTSRTFYTKNKATSCFEDKIVSRIFAASSAYSSLMYRQQQIST